MEPATKKEGDSAHGEAGLHGVVDEFIIKKSAFIVKNEKELSEVYTMSKKALGSGTYGVVHKVTHNVTHQVRACKVIARKKIKNWERF